MKRRSFLKTTLPLALAGQGQAQPGHEPELVFGVIADPQYADQAPKGNRFYRNSLAKLEEAITALNREPLDFVVTLGDLIDTNLESFSRIMPLYDALRAPHRPILGNHDFDVVDADKERVMAAVKLAKPYYAEVRNTWRLLYLDGTDQAIWRHPADDPRTKEAADLLDRMRGKKLAQAHSYNAGLGEKQIQWLRHQLTAAKDEKQRVLVFNHYPVIPAGNPHNLWNAEEVVALLEGHDHVAAYMNGHNHAGNYGTHRGCHYLNLKGMVESEKETAYAVVRCFPDRLEIEGSGLEPDRTLPQGP